MRIIRCRGIMPRRTIVFRGWAATVCMSMQAVVRGACGGGSEARWWCACVCRGMCSMCERERVRISEAADGAMHSRMLHRIGARPKDWREVAKVAMLTACAKAELEREMSRSGCTSLLGPARPSCRGGLCSCRRTKTRSPCHSIGRRAHTADGGCGRNLARGRHDRPWGDEPAAGRSLRAGPVQGPPDASGGGRGADGHTCGAVRDWFRAGAISSGGPRDLVHSHASVATVPPPC